MTTTPKYVALVRSSDRVALRLDGDTYYRDAGNWSIKFKEKDGKLVAVGEWPMQHVDGLELVEITRDEWVEDNRGWESDD